MNYILVDDFIFFNKNNKVLDNKFLKDFSENMLKKEKKFMYWTNKEFAKERVGFKFKRLHNKIYFLMKSYDYNFDYKDYCNLVYEKKGVMFNFNITQEQIDFLESRNLYFEEKLLINKKNNKIKFINSWQDFVNYLIKTGNFHRHISLTDLNYNLKMLFNEQITNFNGDDYDYDSLYRLQYDFYHIIKVIETRLDNINYRIQIYYGIYSKTFYVDVINDKNKYYVYTDENVFYISDRTKHYYFANNIINKTNNKYVFDKNILNKLGNNLYTILSESQYIITQQIYNFYKSDYSEQHKTYCSETEEIINNKYIKLLKQNKTIKINDLNISRKEISLNTENFNLKFNNDFLNVIDNLEEIKTEANKESVKYNFNELYEKILYIARLQYSSFNEPKKYKINNINISIEKIGSRIKINNIFARKGDVFTILKNAICFKTQEDFNKYLKDVSFIGTTWKKIISNGVLLTIINPLKRFNVKNNTDSSDIHIRFSFLWDVDKRSNVYLTINDKKYLIKYKGIFKNTFNRPSYCCSLNELRDKLKESLEDFDSLEFYSILENAIIEAKIVRERGLKLVENTVKDINAKEVVVSINNNNVSGYTFLGRFTKKEYFIDKNTLSVYKKDNNYWNRRCILDDANKQRIFEDKLANRLINIYNEPKKLKKFL